MISPTAGSSTGTTASAWLLAGGDVVTMNATRDVLVGGGVLVVGDRIEAVGATSELRDAHPDVPVVDVGGCVVTPGMIDAHQHLTGDPLIRCCIPDRLPAGEAISEWALPVHAVHEPGDDAVSAAVAAVEALANGVTTVVEAGTVADGDAVAAAVADVGIRATIGVWGWDVADGPFAAPAAEVLERQRALVERCPPGGLVEGWVTLVGHDLASDDLLVGAAGLARELDTGMTMHLSPTSSDPASYLARTGRRPVEHLADLGVLGRHLLIAHGVWLDDAEVDLVLGSETALAYCPWAYLRLGQGVFARGRHAEIAERGGRVALGCDSANAGDSIDVLRAAAAAVGIASDARLDATRFGAHDAFALATVAGAEAIGLGDRVGSIEPGKQADLVVHRTDTPGWTPRGDVAMQLVWGTDGRSVSDVYVAGRLVVADGRVVTVDTAALFAEAAERRAALLARAGIEVPRAWPHRDAT